MKLLLDEMYTPAVAALLRDWGHDAVAVKELPDLVGLADEDLFRVAMAEGRAVVTEDVRDFAAAHQRILDAGQQHSGLILADARRFPRLGPNHVPVLADALAAFLSDHGAMLEDIDSFIWWLQPAPR